MLAIVALAAVVVLVSALAFAIGLGGGSERTPGDPAGSSGPATGPSTTPTPSRAGMESFIASYLDLAVSDPEAAFRELTPSYQDESGGLDGYLGFWGNVESASLLRVVGDPADLQVTYTYRRTERDRKVIDEDVRLQLAFDDTDGTYRIDGELPA